MIKKLGSKPNGDFSPTPTRQLTESEKTSTFVVKDLSQSLPLLCLCFVVWVKHPTPEACVYIFEIGQCTYFTGLL